MTDPASVVESVTDDRASDAGAVLNPIAALRDAARGSVAAYVGLWGMALDAAQTGHAALDEAFGTIEPLAYFAAALGGLEERWALVRFLQSRADDWRARGEIDSADWYSGEAARNLVLLADAGDTDAAAECLDMPARFEGYRWPTADETASTDAFFIAAARGSSDNLANLCDVALDGFRDAASPLEKLARAEMVARLGAAAGHDALTGRLAAVRFLRALWEHEHGNPRRAFEAAFETLQLAFSMAAAGDMQALIGARSAAAAMPDPMFFAVAAQYPAALTLRDCAGTA